MRIAILIVKNIKEYGIDKFDIKNWTYYYFDDMININDFNPETSKQRKNHMKIFSFITVDMKHQMV